VRLQALPRATAWGRTPLGGQLRIEERAGRRWLTVKRLRIKRFATFLVGVPQRGPQRRATQSAPRRASPGLRITRDGP